MSPLSCAGLCMRQGYEKTQRWMPLANLLLRYRRSVRAALALGYFTPPATARLAHSGHYNQPRTPGESTGPWGEPGRDPSSAATLHRSHKRVKERVLSYPLRLSDGLRHRRNRWAKAHNGSNATFALHGSDQLSPTNYPLRSMRQR
jgi:hypothetical protein